METYVKYYISFFLYCVLDIQDKDKNKITHILYVPTETIQPISGISLLAPWTWSQNDTQETSLLPIFKLVMPNLPCP